MTFETAATFRTTMENCPSDQDISDGCALFVGDAAWRNTAMTAMQETFSKRNAVQAQWTDARDSARPHAHLARLVKEFVLVAEQEAPNLIREFRPELAALDGNDETLRSVALPASERRLSRESEYNFRILSAGVRFIVQCLRVLPSFADRTLLVCAPSLDQLDRLTLLALDQLRRRAQAGQGVQVLLGLSSGALAALEPMATRIGQDAGDVDSERARFLRDFLRTSMPHMIEANDDHADPETKLASAASVLPLLDFDVASLLAGLDLGQSDLVLHTIRHADLSREDRTRLLGLTHAYLGNFELALTLYRQWRADADDPLTRARATVYVALLLNKRLNMLAEAKQLLEASLAELKTMTDDDARLERGWLLNGLALVHFRSGDNEAAFGCCREGLGAVGKVGGSDAMHLKVNLINNLSALCEARGDTAGALKVWDRLQQLSSGGDPLFRKVYLYRVAALTYRLGNLHFAREKMLACWREAELLCDTFHQAYVAYDLGVMSLDVGQGTAAKSWFQRARDAADQNLDHTASQRARSALSALPIRPDMSVPVELRPYGTKLGRTFHLIHIPPLKGSA